MQPSIIFQKVSKRYRKGVGLTNIRELFNFQKVFDRETYHWAVKDVDFSLLPGESLGIIGPNGAGKTTILKLLSRVTKQTSGEIIINGRLSALIELGAGFHQDLTGRENIYLNGTILGMRRASIKSRFDEIVAFAGIDDYLDTPVKRYSSGMYARLGFAIAAHVDPKILLVDEVLAVGDFAFQQKCYARMDELRQKGTTLILVSHNMEAIRRVCEKGLVMYRGTNIFMGTSSEAIVKYSDALREHARNYQVEIPDEEGISQRVMTFDAEIDKAQLLSQDDESITVIETGKKAKISIDFHLNKDVVEPIFSLMVRTPNGVTVYDTTTRWMGIQTESFAQGDRYRVEFIFHNNLLPGEYEVGVDIASSNFSHLYDSLERAFSFSVIGTGHAKGIAFLDAKFNILHEKTKQR